MSSEGCTLQTRSLPRGAPSLLTVPLPVRIPGRAVHTDDPAVSPSAVLCFIPSFFLCCVKARRAGALGSSSPIPRVALYVRRPHHSSLGGHLHQPATGQNWRLTRSAHNSTCLSSAAFMSLSLNTMGSATLPSAATHGSHLGFYRGGMVPHPQRR